MKRKTISTFLGVISLFLVGCQSSDTGKESENNSQDSQLSSPESLESTNTEKPSESVVPETEEELFARLSESMYLLDQNVVKRHEATKQEDFYGADFVIQSESQSTSTLYSDKFIQEKGTTKIDSAAPYEFIKETGLADSVNYYVVTAFPDDPSGNTAVKYSLPFDDDLTVFSVGFSAFFSQTMANGILQFRESYPQGKVIHNFDTVDLSTGGDKYFYLKCLVGEDDKFEYKMEIEANIHIQDGAITNSKITALQSLVDNTNYTYSTKDVQYEKGAMTKYEGEKINYEAYL